MQKFIKLTQGGEKYQYTIFINPNHISAMLGKGPTWLRIGEGNEQQFNDWMVNETPEEIMEMINNG